MLMAGIKKVLCEFNEKNIQCMYSPAHIEEIYKVVANEKSQYRDRMTELMELISMVTLNREILPTNVNLIVKEETFQERMMFPTQYMQQRQML